MADDPSKEFLKEKLAHTQAEVENYLIQADTALKYAEQVWWSWNLARRRLKVRSVGECILGYAPSDMEHGEQFWWERIHPEDRREVEQSLQECFAGDQEVWQCEHRLLDVSGDWVWVEQSGFILRRDADGNPVEMAGTTRKTQERYQLLDLFRGSESIIEALVTSSPICFWIRDHEGIILLMSQSMKEQICKPEKKETIESKLCTSKATADWRMAFHSALRGDCIDTKITLAGRDGQSKRYTHHLIPVPLDKPPFGVLEIFLPESD